ncbi:MAG: 5'-deoxynucleotidase [Clostridia bacterium]|nr:5'-deoxynucleotidase [Clostridia bacterium]MDR3644565.1 5'-deoxynucleotidase [Clostridia bacterium]
MSNFFALLSRMKYINRWGLMRNTRPENLEEHSLEVAVIAHTLCQLRNTRFAGSVNGERAALLAIYHDVAEIFTGDLPTPVKYFSAEIREAYRKVEAVSLRRLLQSLPQDLRPGYEPLLFPQPGDAELWQLIKAADKLSALIKCIEEEKAGNTEFKQAASAQLKSIAAMQIPEADCFISEFLPGYRLSLDEQE